MSHHLVLLIGEHWPQSPAVSWVLLDGAGRKTAEGESEPHDWPAATECTVVLSGPQTVWRELRLPGAPRREEARLLAYALEDGLLQDVNSQHLTTTHRHADGNGVRVGVLVVARERLRHILAQLEALGRPPLAVWSGLQLAPAGDDTWHLATLAGGLILRRGARHVEALEGPPEAILPLLQHALIGARATGHAPVALIFHGAAELPDMAEWSRVLGFPIRHESDWSWWRPAAVANLLQGEFRSTRPRVDWLGGLSVPAWVAGGSLIIMLLASLGDVLWQRNQLAGLENKMMRVFQDAVPGMPAIAPAAQLQRELNEVRASRGILRDDDMLVLLAAYAEARGTAARRSLGALRYTDHQLQIEFAAIDHAEFEALRQRLFARGLSMRPAEDGLTSKVLIYREVSQ